MTHVLAKELRKAVLQAAFEGKLTQQSTNDMSAVEMVRTMKIQADETEAPFELPDNWSWVKFGDISTYGKTKRKINAQNANPDTWMLDMEDIEKGGRLLVKKKVSERKAIGDKTIFAKGNILYSKLRPYLLKILIVDEDGICTPELVPFDMLGETNPRYAMFYLKSPYVDSEINKVTYGVKMPRVGTDTMKNLYFPLPPIEEQARIVARVDELMAKIDEYEKLENELVELKKNFPGDMKAAVLQAAMEGRLTEQLKSDSNIYQYIDNVFEIKNKLIKEHVIKKDKTALSFNADDVPFDIPDNWTWVKFGNIANLKVGKTPARAEPIWWGKDDDIPWVSIADMINDSTITKTKEFISEQGFKEKFKCSISPAGTMIMSFKLTVGRVSILGMDAVHNEAIISIFPYKDDANILQKYLFKALPYLVQYGDKKNAIKGETLNQDSLCNLFIPLPPFEEQQRIVEKLDKLLPLCDALCDA